MKFTAILKNRDFVLWIAGVLFCAVLELYGLFNNKDFTFTAIVRHYIPLWLRVIIWLLLGYHFLWGSINR